MSNIKKKANADITSKRIKIKNKKDVQKVLTKNKNTAVTAKKSSNVRKKPTVKKVVVEKPKVTNEELKVDETLLNKDVVTLTKPNNNNYNKNKNKNKNNKPSNKPVARKIEPEEKPIEVEKPVEVEKPIEEEKEVTSAVKNVKKEVKIKKKKEDKDIRTAKVDNLDNIKKRAKKVNEDKNKKNKVPSSKRVKSVYDPEKNRWVIKEDKSKPKETDKKNKKNVPVQTQNLDDTASYLTQTDLGKFKNKFFEEVDVHEYKKVKKEVRAKWPKRIIIATIVIVVLLSTGFIIYKANQERIRRNLNLYPKYNIGQQVNLSDGSKWYVLEDSDGSNPNVVIMPEGLSDLNFDGKIDDKDKRQYSSGSVEYDVKDETSIAYFIENEYKAKFEEKHGKVVDISLMTSKQYVGFRDAMHYPLEFKEQNLLAAEGMTGYWLATSQNGFMYIVRKNGSYKMVKPTTIHPTRMAVTIKKDSLKTD